MNAIIKQVPPEDLPGLQTRSFRMFYEEGEIWFEHLDGIYDYTELALDKFSNDLPLLQRDDFPDRVAILLEATTVNEALARGIVDRLLTLPAGRLKRVAFLGIDNVKKRVFMNVIDALPEPLPFPFYFQRDLERGKKWLVSKTPARNRTKKTRT